MPDVRKADYWRRGEPASFISSPYDSGGFEFLRKQEAPSGLAYYVPDPNIGGWFSKAAFDPTLYGKGWF